VIEVAWAGLAAARSVEATHTIGDRRANGTGYRRRSGPPSISPAVVSPSPYALRLSPEGVRGWRDVRQGGPAVVEPELGPFDIADKPACTWVHLRAYLHTINVQLEYNIHPGDIQSHSPPLLVPLLPAASRITVEQSFSTTE